MHYRVGEKPHPRLLSKGRVAMTADQLTDAARNLAHGLGIPVYIRDGRIYQQGPGVAFLPPTGASLMAGAPALEEEEADETEWMTTPVHDCPGIAAPFGWLDPRKGSHWASDLRSLSAETKGKVLVPNGKWPERGTE
jgi:hypothetical protein